ncbi:nitroreductase/quinone reductase family protein [Streptomyces diastatochromogenes]|uniref:nitroreductase/quinone reductase family protein n=1 Tax=Streptomyces diastatochromogenes TaxID=42236 RepID=UPI003646C262
MLSAALAANVRYPLNLPVRLLLRLGIMLLGYALLEPRVRVSGRPRTTRETLWIVAEHGERAGYVRNIRHCPEVRVRYREGLRFTWRRGTAHALPDDDPYARRRRLGRRHPLRALMRSRCG